MTKEATKKAKALVDGVLTDIQDHGEGAAMDSWKGGIRIWGDSCLWVWIEENQNPRNQWASWVAMWTISTEEAT